MKNKIVLFIFVFLSHFVIYGQIAPQEGDYKSSVNGTWTDLFTHLGKACYKYTSGSWVSSTYPLSVNSGVTVFIDHSVTLIDALTINSGGRIVINAGKSLGAGNKLTNNAGTSGIIIQSNSSGAGQFTHTTTLNGTVEIYLGASEWHLIGSPVNLSVNIPTFFNSSSYLQMWNEPTGWIWNDESGFNNTMAFGLGYSYWNSAAYTYTYTGSLLGTTKSYTSLPYSSALMGFSLLANPFSSALRFTASAWSFPAGMEQVVKVWGYSAGNYTDIVDGDSKRIPIGTGFFVKANASGLDFSIPATEQVSLAINPYKNELEDTRKFAKLNIKNSVNEYADEVRVHFKDNASLNYNSDTDATKLFGSDLSPQLFLLSEDNHELSIKGLDATQISVLKLQLRPNVDATYKITSNEFTFDASTEVLLEDLFTSTIMDVDANLEYTFTSLATDSEDRFRIYVTPIANSIENPVSKEPFQISGSNDQLRIISEEMNYKLMVYNMLGQKLIEKTNLQGNFSLDLSASKQKIIIVSIQTEKEIISKKIQLR
ncbi:MAG TPA: hypothetical protein DCG69_09110 [Bacteroidales bacterium]|nr:hypothetical protein [Bacteroidales bacterium]